MNDSDLALHFIHSSSSPRPAARRLALTSPLRVLAIVSRSPGRADLDLYLERRSLHQAVAERSRVELTVLDAPSPFELLRVLSKGDFQVVHYSGHGSLQAKNGEGALVLGGSLIKPEEFARLMKNAADLRLMVLNACETSRTPPGRMDALNGVATELVRGGIPAVVAMQFPISDRAALAFTHTLYDRLAAGDPVEAAVGEGHIAITREDPQERAPLGLYLPASERLDEDRRERDRYAELVDKKFQSGITKSEQDELLRLRAHLDEADAKLYGPIEEKLETVLAKLRRRSSVG